MPTTKVAHIARRVRDSMTLYPAFTIRVRAFAAFFGGVLQPSASSKDAEATSFLALKGQPSWHEADDLHLSVNRVGYSRCSGSRATCRSTLRQLEVTCSMSFL